MCAIPDACGLLSSTADSQLITITTGGLVNQSDRTGGRRTVSMTCWLTAAAVLPALVVSGSAETVTVTVEVGFAERIELTPLTISEEETAYVTVAPAARASSGPASRGDDALVAAFRLGMTPRRALTVSVDTPDTTGQPAHFLCGYGAMAVTSCDGGLDLISESDAELRVTADSAGNSSAATPGLEVTIAYQ
jgi:hypothetical protein